MFLKIFIFWFEFEYKIIENIYKYFLKILVNVVLLIINFYSGWFIYYSLVGEFVIISIEFDYFWYFRER